MQLNQGQLEKFYNLASVKKETWERKPKFVLQDKRTLYIDSPLSFVTKKGPKRVYIPGVTAWELNRKSVKPIHEAKSAFGLFDNVEKNQMPLQPVWDDKK